MLMRRMVAGVYLFLIPGVVFGQVADATQPGDDAVAAEAGGQLMMQELLSRVSSIQDSMQELTKLRNNVIANTERIGQLGSKMDAQQAELDEIKRQLEELSGQFQDQVARQGEILASISSQDGDQTILPLTAIMDRSPKFKQDLTDAVHRVIQRDGTLEIENKTSSYRRVMVNRTEYGVQAGKTLTLKVPVGTVSTQIDGESLKNWTIGAPNYQQKVDIVPASARTTTYYAPTNNTSTTTTTYYAPTTSTPATSTSAYYAPTTTTAYYAPTTTTAYYAPTTTAYYAPTTTAYYAPTTSTVTAYSVPTTYTSNVVYSPLRTYSYMPVRTYVPTYRYRYRFFRPYFWY